MAFAVVGGQFDVFLVLFVFHPQFVVGPGADDVSGVPLLVDVVGMAAVVHYAADIGAVGVALYKAEHHFGAFVQGEVLAVVGAGVGFG